MGDPLEFWIQLPVLADWRSIDLVRSSVQNCLAAMLSDAEGFPDIAMVAAELLENAVKYGHWGEPDTNFRIRVRGGPDGATVEVENPVPADGDSVSEVFRIISWIASFPTAEEAYRARILEIASVPAGEAGSGLGLVRVAYEADAALEAEIHGRVLRVRATMKSAAERSRRLEGARPP